MNQVLTWGQLSEVIQDLVSFSAITEAGVLVSCLGLSWLMCSALRRLFKVPGSVLLGRRIVDGVLFPVLALLLAWLASHLLASMLKPVVLKLAIPVLVSLVLIRLSVRVLAAAFPESAWVRATERTISWLAWIGVILWVTGVLPAVLDQLDAVKWKIGNAQMSLRTLIEGALTATVVMIIALWVSAAIEKRIAHGSAADLSTRKMISNIVRTCLLFIGLLFAMSAVGIDLTALSVLGGAFGVGLGLGLQKIAANYVSGFVILAERSLRIGDTVKVDNFEGCISDIRTRYTVIRALNGREALVPNEMLLIHRVENATRITKDARIQISVPIQVAHGTDVRALQPRLVAALATVPRVLVEPAPFILLAHFVPNGMELMVRYWIADPNTEQDVVKSQANLAVLDALRAQGVEFPASQRIMLQGLEKFYPEDSPG